MKFVAVFLACIVAAQAATYSCPSYDYWCSHNFHVLPARSYYCYTVPFSRSWCTSQYYADCLFEFPQPLTGAEESCEAEKANVEDIITGYETKLSNARNTIRDELNEGLAPFESDLDDLHATYLSTFMLYLKNCYDENSSEYTTKVADYQDELAALKTQAVADFNTAVAAAITRIETFHGQIITQFRSCLTNRTSRLNSYNLKLDERATCIVTQYRERLEAIVTKKVDFVKCVFDRLYADKSKDAQYDNAMINYEAELTAQVNADVAAFQGEVDTAVAALKESYRCNYKCYFQTGCYGFSRKSYSRSCISFPSPPKTSYKLVGVGQFKADWNGAAYNCLRTCTAEEKTCTFDDQTHITEIGTKVEGYKSDLADKVVEWQGQVTAWEATATESLTATVQCMIPKTYCGVAPTEAEIQAYQATAQTQATNWIAAKKTELLAQITALETRITGQIDSWKIRAEAYITKVKAQFDCCVNNKNTKISSYTTSLEEKRVAQRAALVTRMNEFATQHKSQFDQFFLCAFGEAPVDTLIQNLKTHYHGCVQTKVDDVLAKFDAFWTEWQPQLVEHYTCGFKCTTKVTTPCLNLKYSWNFCAPSVSSCRFYC